MGARLLGIYLNDHLGGSVSGLGLARRAAASNQGTEYGAFLEALAAEIEEDRESLQKIMDGLAIRCDPVKQAGGWLIEKVGRAKLNGQLRGYSPLSRVVELEGLYAGVSGKLSCWRLLHACFGPRFAGADLGELAARAESQLAGLSEHRDRAGREAFAEEAGAVSR